MGRKQITGLYNRNGVWHIDKQIKGYGRLRESTGCSSREEAEEFLIHKLEEIRKAKVYGIWPNRVWREAAAKYLLDNLDMPSIDDVDTQLRILDQYIGDVELDKLHDGSLDKFKADRKKAGLNTQAKYGVANRTINIALELIIRILNLAAEKWRDEFGMTWLAKAPAITKLDERKGKRDPYPMSWKEQRLLMRELPEHLATMALFKVNTGLREQEVCRLEWDWEIKLPELGASVFLIPADFGGRDANSGVKNREERLVVLNSVARSIVTLQRGQHPIYVFPFGDTYLRRMNERSWRKARTRAAEAYKAAYGREATPGFANFRVHDLKHTFGHRLRVAGVPFEDRQVLLGHKNKSVTTHYSAPEIGNLIKLAEMVKETDNRQMMATTILRRKTA